MPRRNRKRKNNRGNNNKECDASWRALAREIGNAGGELVHRGNPQVWILAGQEFTIPTKSMGSQAEPELWAKFEFVLSLLPAPLEIERIDLRKLNGFPKPEDPIY